MVVEHFHHNYVHTLRSYIYTGVRADVQDVKTNLLLRRLQAIASYSRHETRLATGEKIPCLAGVAYNRNSDLWLNGTFVLKIFDKLLSVWCNFSSVELKCFERIRFIC